MVESFDNVQHPFQFIWLSRTDEILTAILELDQKSLGASHSIRRAVAGKESDTNTSNESMLYDLGMFDLGPCYPLIEKWENMKVKTTFIDDQVQP